jgi:tol-pal system protein YbgF
MEPAALGLRRRGRDGAGGRIVIRRLVAAFALIAGAAALPAPATAANKDMERLQLQVATLQSQLAEIQRTADESRREVKRLTELLAEQNALLQKVAADRRQQDEATATGLKDLSDRVAELAEAIQALKGSAIVPMPAAGPGGASSSAPTTAAGAPMASGAPAGAATSGATAPTPGPATPPPAGPAPAPRELYSQAYADYARGNYDLAVQGFTEYIRNYPGTDFTDNAQYWIGECLYGKKLYNDAVEAWNVLFRDYPSSDKLPDARVKKGMALERLGRRSQALVEYRYVVDRFPNSQAARIAREHLNP